MKPLLEYLISKENKGKVSFRDRFPSDYFDEIEEYLSSHEMYGVAKGIMNEAIFVYPKGKKATLKNLLFMIGGVDYIDWGSHTDLKRKYEKDLLNIMNK